MGTKLLPRFLFSEKFLSKGYAEGKSREREKEVKASWTGGDTSTSCKGRGFLKMKAVLGAGHLRSTCLTSPLFSAFQSASLPVRPHTWISASPRTTHRRLIPNHKGHMEMIFQEMSKSSLLNLMKVKF